MGLHAAPSVIGRSAVPRRSVADVRCSLKRPGWSAGVLTFALLAAGCGSAPSGAGSRPPAATRATPSAAANCTGASTRPGKWQRLEPPDPLAASFSGGLASGTRIILYGSARQADGGSTAALWVRSAASWKVIRLAGGIRIAAVVQLPARLVAVGSAAGGRLMIWSSSDGNTWSEVRLRGPQQLSTPPRTETAVVGDQLWTIVEQGASRWLVTSDGLAATTQLIPAFRDANIQLLASDGARAMVVTQSPAGDWKLFTTTDSKSWNQLTFPDPGAGANAGVATSCDLLLIGEEVGVGDPPPSVTVAHASADGRQWSAITLPAEVANEGIDAIGRGDHGLMLAVPGQDGQALTWSCDDALTSCVRNSTLPGIHDSLELLQWTAHHWLATGRCACPPYDNGVDAAWIAPSS